MCTLGASDEMIDDLIYLVFVNKDIIIDLVLILKRNSKKIK